MTETDLDMIIFEMERDARLIGCATRGQLQKREAELVSIQDEIARAIEKVRRLAA